jgi:hypothetical protein
MRATSLVLAAWVALGPAGCQVWTTAPPLPTASNGIYGEPRLVRLTLDDGRVVKLRNPAIQNDSISGGLIEGGETGGSPIAFPLSKVRQLDRAHVSRGRTVVLVLGIGAAAFVTFAAYAIHGLSQLDFTSDCPVCRY